MTYFQSKQKRSLLRREILAAFCFNRSGEIQGKASYIADIQGFLGFGYVSAHPLFWPGERKTDFRPKHIPCSQSAHYMKHFPRRSLPRCGHHALVCIPMLSTKIRNLQAKYKLKIRFCAATAPAARAFPNDSIRRVARMKAPRPAGSYRPSVCGRCSRSARR